MIYLKTPLIFRVSSYYIKRFFFLLTISIFPVIIRCFLRSGARHKRKEKRCVFCEGKRKDSLSTHRGPDCLQTGCFRLHNMYAGVARSTIRLPGRRWPTSKLCLLLRVKVPITPMGDAHLLHYLYHSPNAMSRFFCKNYLYFSTFRCRKMVDSTDMVQKSIGIPYLVSFCPDIVRCSFC